MKTPIYDFVKSYQEKNPLRFHMPGHKGKSFLGIESWDITEISGADGLYEAEGIIAESEKNATLLFGSRNTFYSTEGSSQCLKAMLYLLLMESKKEEKKRPYIIAGRNAHKAFLYGAALLNLEIVWWQEEERTSLCSCNLVPSSLEEIIDKREESPIGVYITSPDYLGNILPIKEIADICHKYKTYLAVDNAHGAYLRFLNPSLHPMDLGADLCCDSAHKTLPVLTGGAYLHIGKGMKPGIEKQGKQALALFGSTSPSYLTLISLDYCNRYLKEEYSKKLETTLKLLEKLKENLIDQGWKVEETEPLKLTVFVNYKDKGKKRGGLWLAERLAKEGIYIEYADAEFIVFMFTPENDVKEIEKLKESFFSLKNERNKWQEEQNKISWNNEKHSQVLSVRKALLEERETISVGDSVGRICADPLVSCPPAIPVLVSGERIEERDLEIFNYYGIKNISVVKEYISK